MEGRQEGLEPLNYAYDLSPKAVKWRLQLGHLPLDVQQLANVVASLLAKRPQSQVRKVKILQVGLSLEFVHAALYGHAGLREPAARLAGHLR